MRQLASLLLLAALGLPLAACGSDAPAGNPGASGDTPKPTLRFSAIPSEKATKLKEKFTTFGKWLSKELGVPVEYVASDDYGASVKMFEKGEIQFAWFGGLTGVQARQKVEGARAIAQGAEDPEYFSYFIAHKDAGVTPSMDQNKFPEGLAGKTFTFGSTKSTSGRLMPEFFIRKFTGKSPEAFFGSKPQFSNAHPKTAENVQAGSVQVGALSYRTYDKMVENKEIDPAVCVVVWKTPFYADYNFTAHPALEEMYGAGFTEKLKAAILRYDDQDVLDNGFQRSKFIEAKNADFDKIKNTATELGFLDD